MWFKESNRYFYKIENSLNEEINEWILSNPHLISNMYTHQCAPTSAQKKLQQEAAIPTCTQSNLIQYTLKIIQYTLQIIWVTDI